MKRILGSIILTCFFAAVVSAAYGAEKDVKRHVLDNGMVVVLKEMPSSPVVSIRPLVKTGSATEGKYLGSGISHFLEHMLFKGTHARDVGRIASEVRALGGRINASTGFDYTVYSLDLPAGDFGKGLHILADMLMNATFDPEEFEKEREVILNEMRMIWDNPKWWLGRLVLENVYTRHPYRYMAIGHEQLLKALTRDDLVDYYGSKYSPNNIIFSAAGNFDSDIALAQITKAFEDFKPRPYIARNLPQEPIPLASRRVESQYPTELTRISMAYQGVSIFDSDMFALDVLAIILGRGRSSLLYQDVVEKKGLATAVSAENFTPEDKGYFAITCVAKEGQAENAIDAIKSQIKNIKAKDINLGQLNKARRQVLSQHIFELETAAGTAYDMAVNEAIFADYDFSRKYVEGVREVSADDIARVANKYLNDKTSTIVILKPESDDKKKAKQKSLPEAQETKKIVLDNGMTIILRQLRSVPTVSIALALEGGLRQETEEKNGLSNLAMWLWTKGTQSRTAQEIAGKCRVAWSETRRFFRPK